VVQHELRDQKSARDAYERALKIQADIPAVLYNLALLHEQGDATYEAEKLYEKVLQGNPDWEDAWFRLGYLRLQRRTTAARSRPLKTASASARPGRKHR